MNKRSGWSYIHRGREGGREMLLPQVKTAAPSTHLCHPMIDKKKLTLEQAALVVKQGGMEALRFKSNI